LIDSFTKRVGLDAKLLCYLAPTFSGIKQLLSALFDFIGDDAAASGFSWLEKSLRSRFSVFLHAAVDTIFRHAEGAHDLGLFTHPLTNQLRGEHSKRPSVIITVKENRIDSAEVKPF